MLTVFDPEDDIDTVVASNVSPRDTISPPDTIAHVQNTMHAPAQMAIADSGATQIFIMEGTPVKINALHNAHSRLPLPMDEK